MSTLATRVEITKLAGDLQVAEGDLGFLRNLGAGDVRALRTAASGALFARSEPRLQRVRALAGMLPIPVTAKIGEHILGPLLAARVAAVLPPEAAVKLAAAMKPAFLAKLSLSLDPVRAAPILRALPDSLIIDVGRRLLAQGEHITIGRFTSVVSVHASMGVIESADGVDLLKIALFTEDKSALEAIVRRLDDEALRSTIHAAHVEKAYDDTVALLSALSTQSASRLVGLVDTLDQEGIEALVASVVRNDEWREILPALADVDPSVIRLLVNVPATLFVDVIDRVLLVGRAANGGGAGVVSLLLALDDEHLEVLRSSELMRHGSTRDWLLEHAGPSRRQVQAFLTDLGH